MSIESAKLFIDRMKTDEVFAKKVNECKDSESRNSFANAEGFDFTVEEIKEAGSELSVEEMEQVAGGGTARCCWSGYIEFIN